ncbi:hypothetical protein [Deferribacter abyssi]|uniref:hypothetical protein n=1 Tax=Deferribacter abyssi TaxID=213806 RepID=UPI003C25CA25
MKEDVKLLSFHTEKGKECFDMITNLALCGADKDTIIKEIKKFYENLKEQDNGQKLDWNKKQDVFTERGRECLDMINILKENNFSEKTIKIAIFKYWIKEEVSIRDADIIK